MTSMTRTRYARTHSDGTRLTADTPTHKAYERMLREERAMSSRGHRSDRRPVMGRKTRRAEVA